MMWAQIQIIFKGLFLALRQNFEDQVAAGVRRNIAIVKLYHLAMNAHVRRRVARDVKVRGPLLFRLPEKVIKSGHRSILDLSYQVWLL